MNNEYSDTSGAHGYRELIRLVSGLEAGSHFSEFESLNFRAMTKVYVQVLVSKIVRKIKNRFRREAY